MRGLKDVGVAGKRVLLRTSLNVPVGADGKVSDDFRLRRDLPTLEYLLSHGGRVIVVGYFGREGKTLRPVAEALAGLIPSHSVRFTDTPVSEVMAEAEKLSSGECLVLENIRREKGEETNDEGLARLLAGLCDIFVDDAFAEAHRPYASNLGVTQFAPSYAGFLLEEEVEHLSEALTPPTGSLAVIGGAKFETKEPLIKRFLGLYSSICVGGIIANDFLKAKGLPVGVSRLSDVPLPSNLAGDPRILVPSDAIVSSKRGTRTCSILDIKEDETIVDAGPETARAWSEKITQSPFVLWNGPLGVYEKGCTDATDSIAKALVDSSARAAVGGGDTIAALEKFSFDTSRIFRSTGGGAMLQFLADGTLVCIEPLRM